VLSPSHEKTDLVKKRAVYEKNGVREYWIVDPREQHVCILLLENGTFKDERVIDTGGTVESRVLPGFRMAVASIFAD
jgi:Uma2 family endonuclease